MADGWRIPVAHLDDGLVAAVSRRVQRRGLALVLRVERRVRIDERLDRVREAVPCGGVGSISRSRVRCPLLW